MNSTVTSQPLVISPGARALEFVLGTIGGIGIFAVCLAIVGRPFGTTQWLIVFAVTAFNAIRTFRASAPVAEAPAEAKQESIG